MSWVSAALRLRSSTHLRMDRVGSAISVCWSAEGAPVVGLAFMQSLNQHSAGQGVKKLRNSVVIRSIREGNAEKMDAEGEIEAS